MAQIPYEFLVRWNHTTGALQGAYVKTFDSVTLQEGQPQPVAIAGQNGFPLADVLAAIQSGAIISMDNANAALSVAQAKLTAAGIV